MSRLTEHRLATLLREAVPEPDAEPDRADRVRRRARRIRRRRWSLGSAAVVVVALAVAVPTLLGTGETTRDAAPPAATPSAGWTAGGPCSGAACDPAAVVAAIRKPLDLPTLAPGEKCPVSRSQRFEGGAGFSGPFFARGPGPLYLGGFSKGPGGLAMSTDGPRGWLTQKVVWVVDGSYPGPLLLRGARIDGDGSLGFAHYLNAVGYPGSGSGDGKVHPTLAYVRGGLNAAEPGSFAYRNGPASLDDYPSGIYVDKPGCYAIQVDGVDFSETLVFRATVPR